MRKNIKDDYREKLGKATFGLFLKLLLIPLVLTSVFIIVFLLDTAKKEKNSTRDDNCNKSSYISISGDIANEDVIFVTPETNVKN